MRFRGFSLMHSLLENHQEDLRIVELVRLYFWHGFAWKRLTRHVHPSSLQILSSLKNWPLMNRNKVEDSKIEEPVKQIAEGNCAERPAASSLAREVRFCVDEFCASYALLYIDDIFCSPSASLLVVRP